MRIEARRGRRHRRHRRPIVSVLTMAIILQKIEMVAKVRPGHEEPFRDPRDCTT